MNTCNQLITVIQDQLTIVQSFWSHQFVLLFIAVSIENIITDLAELTRGMDMTKREFEARKERDPPLILKDFLNNSEDKLKKLKQDAKTAQVRI